MAPGGAWPVGPFVRGCPIDVLYAAVIAARITRALTAHGWTFAELARHADVAIGDVGAVLDGDRIADLPMLAGVEGVLGASVWPSRDEADRLAGGGRQLL